MTQILYARGLWGMPEASLLDQCQRIADAGFDAVEAFIPQNDDVWQQQLAQALDASGLHLIAQAHTRRDHDKGPNGSDDAIERANALWQQVAALKPVMVNGMLAQIANLIAGTIS